MNVSCTSCSAKYAVPDEKVRGKKVKITCKHCGTGIIVDGTKLDAAAAVAPATASVAPVPTASAAAAPVAAAAKPVAVAAPAAAPAATKVTAPTPAAAPTPIKAAAPAAVAAAAPAAAPPNAPSIPELSFDIAYPDDRQETLTLSQIVDQYAAGTLDDEAFIWRDGMSDWKAPFDIPEVASALTQRGLSKKAEAEATFAADDEATRVQGSPFDVEPTGPAGVWREPAKEAPSSPEAAFDLTARVPLPFEQPEPAAGPPPATASPRPAAVAAKKDEAPKAAARRSAARGGGDLFGDLAAAGGEEDESLGSEARDAAPAKLTGARNESSVLFSLDALVKQEQKPAAKKAPTKKKEDDDAAILMGTDSGPSSLSNIGTGQFGSAFAAPDFTAPVLAPPPELRASDPVELPSAASLPKKKSGMGIWIAIVAMLLLGGGAFAMGLPGKLMPPPPAPSAAATPAAKAEPAPTPAEPTPAAPTPSSATSAAPVAPAAAVAGTGGAASKPTEASKPADATKPTDKPADAAKPADKPADKPAEPAASDAPPFDKGAAVAALTAAAGNAQSCKTPDGPTGSGKVSITFMPSGRATNTQVSGDLAGTAVGGCVARLFRSAKVPAFSGEAVTVSKSFAVQ